MEPIINTEYQQIKVSSDEKLLKRRAAPQTVRILNKEFDEYMKMYNTSVQMNIENSDWLYDRIPENLEGKLEYKDLTWDFMLAAYYRLGMIAAVSEKVKNILEELNVSKEEYTLKPIKIKGYDITYYLMFVSLISDEEILIKNSDIRFFEEPERKLPIETLEQVHEYDKHMNTYVFYKTMALSKKFQARDIIYVLRATIYPHFSKRLIDAFEKNKVKGWEFFYESKLKFI